MHKKVQVLSILRKEDKGDGMMERLTYRTTKGEAIGNSSIADIGDILEKLAEYEDLEEQGLLLRLPCKVGTTVYNTTWWDDVQEKVKVDGKTFYRTVHKHKVSKSTFSLLDIYDFGKTVFLTKEEAEQKLKEMEGE